MTGTGRAIVSTPAIAHKEPTIFPQTPTGLKQRERAGFYSAAGHCLSNVEIASFHSSRNSVLGVVFLSCVSLPCRVECGATYAVLMEAPIDIHGVRLRARVRSLAISQLNDSFSFSSSSSSSFSFFHRE